MTSNKTFNYYWRVPLWVLFWTLFCMYILCPFLFYKEGEEYGYYHTMVGIIGLGYIAIEVKFSNYKHYWKDDWIYIYGWVFMLSMYSPMIGIIGNVVNVVPIFQLILE